MAKEDFIGKRIEIENETLLKEWCGILNCHEKDLMDAIFRVGNSASAVDSFLTMNHKKKDHNGDPSA